MREVDFERSCDTLRYGPSEDILKELLDHTSMCLRACAPPNRVLMKCRGMWGDVSTLTDVEYNENVGAKEPGQEGVNGYLAFPPASRPGCVTPV